jgi:hypothetical protein
MTNLPAGGDLALQLRCEQRSFPPYDAFHGTPDTMVWRRATIETPRGSAVFEQSDYGHPGRWNDWEQRTIAVPLTSRMAELRRLVEALSPLL